MWSKSTAGVKTSSPRPKQSTEVSARLTNHKTCHTDFDSIMGNLNLYLPCHFTLVYVDTSFAEETSTSLRFPADVRLEEVEIWIIVNHFEIADSSVTLEDNQCQRMKKN